MNLGSVRVDAMGVRPHVALLLLPVLLGAGGGWQAGATGAARGFVTAVLLILSAVHLELARRAAMQAAGAAAVELVLTPLGGALRLERALQTPAMRLAFAFGSLPGPLTVLACVLLAVGSVPAPPAVFGGHYLADLFWWNTALALGHVLPVLPFGMGRLLVADRFLRADGAVAVLASAVAGRVLGLALAAAGLWVHPYAVLFGLLVIVLAGVESALSARGAARITGRFGQSY